MCFYVVIIGEQTNNIHPLKTNAMLLNILTSIDSNVIVAVISVAGISAKALHIKLSERKTKK